jgi:hypothetical protein
MTSGSSSTSSDSTDSTVVPSLDTTIVPAVITQATQAVSIATPALTDDATNVATAASTTDAASSESLLDQDQSASNSKKLSGAQTFKVSVPAHHAVIALQTKSQMQAKQNFAASGGSSLSNTEMLNLLNKPVDPNCVPVEICTGGDMVPYSDGVAGNTSVPMTRGMCYKWCPIGCGCC